MPRVPPKSCRIPQFFIVLPLLRSVVGRHDSPPKFGEMHIHGLPRLGHPDTSDIGTALCRRLLVLLGPVSELAPPVPSVTRAVVSELTPPLGGLCRSFCLELPVLLFPALVLLFLAPVLLFPTPVSVCGPTRRLPSCLGYRGYYDNSIGR